VRSIARKTGNFDLDTVLTAHKNVKREAARAKLDTPEKQSQYVKEHGEAKFRAYLSGELDEAEAGVSK
jgi:hypothetical protein